MLRAVPNITPKHVALLLLATTAAAAAAELPCAQNVAAYSCNDIVAGQTLCASNNNTKAGHELEKVEDEAWNTDHSSGCDACGKFSDYMQAECARDPSLCYDGCDDDDTKPDDNDDDDDKFLVKYGYIIGILLTVGGCFISNLGTNLQKVSLNANSRKPTHLQVSVFKQPMWVVGIVCMVLGSISDFVALAFAPQSLLAPLATFTLVFNVFMAQYLNKETPSIMNVVATCIIVAATVIIVLNGDSDAKCYKVHSFTISRHTNNRPPSELNN